jgi:hypothetical protein
MKTAKEIILEIYSDHLKKLIGDDPSSTSSKMMKVCEYEFEKKITELEITAMHKYADQFIDEAIGITPENAYELHCLKDQLK